MVRNNWLGLGPGGWSATLTVGALLAGCTTPATGLSPPAVSDGCGRQQVAVISMSASEQSTELASFGEQVAAAVVGRAIVCGDPFVVLGTAGGSSRVVVSPQDVGQLRLDRPPNERARQRRLEQRYDDLTNIVHEQFAATREHFGGPVGMSLPALYGAAAERTADDTGARVTIVTDGVHVDADVDLNRPLERGEAEAMAADLPTVNAPDIEVVLAGLGQMDASKPAPGATWVAEVVSFNDAYCQRIAASCTAYTAATVEEALG